MIETCVNYNFFFDSFSTRSPSHHSELYFFAECEERVIETCVNYLCGRRGIWAIGNNDRCVAIVALQWSVTMIGAPRVLITVITQPDAGRQILQSALCGYPTVPQWIRSTKHRYCSKLSSNHVNNTESQTSMGTLGLTLVGSNSGWVENYRERTGHQSADPQTLQIEI